MNRTTPSRFRTIPAAALAAALAVGLAWAPASPAQDFSRFVAIGDSLGAGYLNNGLVDDGQERAYPVLVARQGGAAALDLPLISDPGIPPLLAIVGFSNGTPVLAPRSNQPGAPLNLNLPRPYDNLSVPGFRAEDVIRTVTGNAIIDIILRGQGVAINQALIQDPTFATIWIGNNDVLGAATSGIVVDGVTLTRVSDFRDALEGIVRALTNGGRDAAVATIPNVTVLPFVTTIPPVVVNPATRQPVLVNGQPIPLIGPDGPLGPGDRVLLTATAQLAVGKGIPAQLGGTGQPLTDSVVLSAAEVAAIRTRTAQLNDVIRTVAQAEGAALVPIDQRFDEIAQNGLGVGGNITVTTAYLTGGLFSYDGVHPTPLGQAIVANEFIRAINAEFGNSIPPVDLFPFLFGPDGSAGATIELPGLFEGTPIFSAAAAEALRLTLRVPPTAELLRIKAERERKGGKRGKPDRPVVRRGHRSQG